MSQPNTTLYINNLNDKVPKHELRTQLYALFSTYGKLIDVVAHKNARMRGQAFLVFSDLPAATAALRACEGMQFYDKPMHIDYAKSKSYATLKREDPNFVPPSAALHASAGLRSEKRQRDDGDDGDRAAKREKGDDDDGEEMEIDEDDESAPQKPQNPLPGDFIPAAVQAPSSRLVCTNLPQEVTDQVLSVLFQQYQGFQSIHCAWSPTPNPDGSRVKFAQAYFDNAELATKAKDGLNGFTLKKGWVMSVAYY